MARFFIDRPIFAWVIALLIMLAGIVSITALPVSQYPAIAPPKVTIRATYPGASAQVVEESVSAIIEQEMNGVPGLMYMEAKSSSNMAEVTITFKQGTDSDMAAVEVQNRLKVVDTKLPEAVRRQGITVEKSGNSFLQIVSLWSDSDRYNAVDLGEFASSNVMPVLKRVEGVGAVMTFATEKAMRIWPNPEKMSAFSISAGDIVAAVQAYNSRIIIGELGQGSLEPNAPINATVVSEEALVTPEEFARIPLRMKQDGSALRLGDIARVEYGAENDNFSSRVNGRPSASMGVQLANGANAMATAQRVDEALENIAAFFPEGIHYSTPYDTSSFVKTSIIEVVRTLLEAIALVFVVMYLFLQNVRATLIPTIVVPVALLGTFAAMLAMGFSINMLTMFGMVLAIGILVDDAIVVVENVERIIHEEGLSPREAAIKAMQQISSAIVGITAVLVSVFIPMAFFSGAAGNIYRQFSVSLAVSIAFSAFLALSLTPALCAAFLKPASTTSHKSTGFFAWFNNWFDKSSQRYSAKIGSILQKPMRWIALYGAIIAVAALLFVRLPGSFMPSEDQGMLMGMVILPPGSTQAETQKVLTEYEDYLKNEPVSYATSILGWNFYGIGANGGMLFISLKDASERGPGQSAQEIADRITGHFAPKMAQGTMVLGIAPPPIMEMGSMDGFDFRMQDRGGIGYAAMVERRDQLLAAAAKHKALTGVRFAGQHDAPRLKLELDRDKAAAMGVPLQEVSAALAVLFGSNYVGDFILNGQVRRVVVQADSSSRLSPEDINKIQVRNKEGNMVELGSIAHLEWTARPPQLTRYNGFPSFTLNGTPAPGHSSGEAMLAMEELASSMPGIGFEWSGQSYEERLAGNQAAALFSLSIVVVFLVLAALYESWYIPFAVLMVVPLGVLGAVLGVTLRGLPNDIYFKVGLISIIGLSAKNSILIVEVAKELWRGGMKLFDALITACRMRLRPIIMTSLAFGVGVIPLAVSSSGSQKAIGSGVLGGIITGTFFAIFLVPVFFVIIAKVIMWRRNKTQAGKS